MQGSTRAQQRTTPASDGLAALVVLALAGPLALASGCSSSTSGPSAAAGTEADGGSVSDAAAPVPDAAALVRWWEAAPLPGTPVAYSRTVALGHRLFVLGGRTVNLPGMPGAPALGVYAYDPVTAQWDEHTPLPELIDQPNIAAAAGKIYVLGGTGVAAIYVYDPEARVWSERGERPVEFGIGASAVATLGTKIYLAGGEIPSPSNPRGRRVSDFASYDTASETWEALPALLEESAYFGAAFLDGVLFTVGGSTEQREIARPGRTMAFDLATRTWSEKSPALDAVSSFAAAVADHRWYVVGGVTGATGRINPETQVYDPGADTWSTTSPMTPPRFAMEAAFLDGNIYVAGGVAQETESTFVPVNTVDVLGP